MTTPPSSRATSFLLLTTLLLPCCKPSPQRTEDSLVEAPPLTPHPWPMVHHDATRSGGSMDSPFKESPPSSPPRAITLPGKLHHLDAPVITNQHIGCIGSVGETLHTPDPHDGVYCVDLDTFTLSSFTTTSHDALHTTLGAAHLFVTTSAGELLAIDLDTLRPRTGDEKASPRVAWRVQLPAPAPAPSLIPSATSHTAPLLIADQQGNLLAIDQRTGAPRWSKTLPAGVRAPLSAHEDALIVATTRGDVLSLDIDTGDTRWQTITTYLPESDEGALDTAPTPRRARHEAAPAIDTSRRLIVLAYMRDSPQSTPPILALSLDSGEIVWEASANTTHRSAWHDQRVAPVLIEDRAIFIEPFSPLTASVSLDDGSMLFLSNRPSCIQQQHSSIVHAADISYVPRHDGVLHAMTSGYGLSPWFRLTQTPDAVDPKTTPYFQTFREAYEQGRCLEDPPNTSGFITTPALTATGDILVGRADGTLLLYR